MNRKNLRRLQASFAKRGGKFWANPDESPELTVAMLTELLACPDCRPAVLEACGAEGSQDIDAKIRALVFSGDH